MVNRLLSEKKIVLDVMLCLLLVFAVWAVYGQLKNFDFIFFDDSLYVTQNPQVTAGLTFDSMHWAFIFKDSDYLTYWHPLTWLSHMLDVQLFGLNAGRHHQVNLFLHMANSLLLFLVFKRMTGARWQSAFVAALFALHPLNVETVAWVAERKNILSTFLWLLTMLAFVAYAEKPSFSRYLATLGLFLLGLMAKPMLVTLPFVFLLLDYWPLGRSEILRINNLPSMIETQGTFIKPVFPRFKVSRLVVEKVPFLLISLAVVYLSSTSLNSFGSMITVERVPMLLRISNALVTYFKYIQKMIWPQSLIFFYPYPGNVPLWQIASAFVFLGLTTLLIMRAIRKKPYLGVGWLWYLGTLVPVIGLVQAGLWPEMADRWAYVPLIGLFIMAAWGIPELLSRWRLKTIGFSVLAGFVILSFSIVAWNQVRYWQNSIMLLEHALKVDKNNLVTHMAIAGVLEKDGRLDEAINHYAETLRIAPGYADGYVSMGIALAKQGKINDAKKYFFDALSRNPKLAPAYFNLGKVFADNNEPEEALTHYHAAIRIDPKFIEAYNNMGNILFKQGRMADAIRVYSDALKIDPENSMILNNLKKIVSDPGRLKFVP